MLKFSGLIATLALAGVALAAPKPTMLAANFNGQLFRLNPTTTETELIGTVPLAGVNAMAMSPTGVLYVATFTAPRTLARIDWSDASIVTTISTALIDVRDMAFVGNTLYGIQEGTTDSLVTINTTTGAQTSIGSTGNTGIQALAALPNGELYAWSTTHGLMKINPATGLATDVNGSLNGPTIQGLVFERDGRLFGIGGSGIFRIDTATGGTTFVAAALGDSRALTFLPRSYRVMCSPISGLSGQRFVFDTGTMERTNVSASTGGSAGIVGAPGSTLYHMSGSTLMRMDAGNSATTSIGFTGLMTDLAFDGTDLWGVLAGTLNRINPTTAGLTPIGPTGFANIVGLAMIGNTLYGWSTTAGLLTINRNTGVATDVNAAIAGTSDIQDLEPLPDGTLLGFGAALYVIDPSTGSFLERGSPFLETVGGAGVITDNARMISTTLAGGHVGRVHTDRNGTFNPIGWSASVQIVGMGFGDDGYLYGGMSAPDQLVRVDPANGICTPFGPATLSNPNGIAWFDGEMYVCNSGNDRLARYDFVSGTYADLLGFPNQASSLIAHPTGSFLSWDLSVTPGMIRVDPMTLDVTTNTSAGSGPADLACYPDGVVVAVNAAGTWQRVEPMTASFANTIGVSQVGGIAYVGEQFTLNANPQDYVGDPKKIMLEIEFRHPGTSMVAETRKLRMETLSQTHVGTFLRGRYDVSIKASHWLRRTLPSIAVDGGITLNTTLINGDINNDNRIDSDDYDILVAQFGTAGDLADLDGGGSVDSDDFDILVKNFGDIGDN